MVFHLWYVLLHFKFSPRDWVVPLRITAVFHGKGILVWRSGPCKYVVPQRFSRHPN